MWFGGMVLTLFEFLSSHDTLDIWAIIFSTLVTGFGAIFFSDQDLHLDIDDTKDYLKEAIQFRRSAQSRLDLISLMQQRQNGSGFSLLLETILNHSSEHVCRRT